MASYKITLDKRSGTGGTDAIWYDTVSATFYADDGLTEPVDIVTPPTRECWAFDGFFSAATGGTQYIDEFGNITDALRERSFTAAIPIYAQWTRVSYKLTLNDNNGSGGSGALFWKIDTEETDRLYSDDLCTSPASSVSRPSRSAFAFEGYYNGTSTPGAKYVNADGSFAEALTGITLTNDSKVIYARWVAAFKFTVSANGGTGGTAAFWYDSLSAKFYDGPDLRNAITAIVPHRRPSFLLLGYMATNSDSGIQRVAGDGLIDAGWAPTAPATIFARWVRLTWKLTLAKGGGTGGTDALYCSTGVGTRPGWYVDDMCEARATRADPPTRDGYAAMGAFTAPSGGTLMIGRDGTFTEAFEATELTTDKTYTWQWSALHRMSLDRRGGTGGTDAFWYSAVDAAFFADTELAEAITSVTPPTLECHRFDGYFSAATGGTLLVAADGTFAAALYSPAPTAAKTLHARWTRISYRLTLNDNGGDGGSGAVYFDGANNAFFADYMLTERVTSVIAPVRPGYDFIGYYSTAAASGGSRYVDETGLIVVAIALTAGATVYARWSPRTYALAFDYNGGTGAVQSKPVTMGAAVGALPAATNANGILEGWFVGERRLAATTAWDIPEDAVAVARWRYYFGNLTDFFGLETADGPLMLVASDTGATRAVTETSHAGALAIQAGDSAVGAFAAGPVLRNPTCTYRVRKGGNVTVRMGKAFGRIEGNASGYMLVSAEYATEADGEPVLVVRGAANEGADAINRWDVTLAVSPDHVAQDPLNAVSGGGELVACRTLVTCDAVVPTENGMPCASDVVHGKVVVTATTAAYFGEDAPTARSPFFETNGVPKAEGDVDFTTYAIAAERSL